MRKIFYILSGLFLFLNLNTKAQVHTGDLIINTQAQVDAFNFTQVTGKLFIKQLTPGAILNLDGLSELTTVGESIFITDCASLTNLNGLSHLTTVGEIFGIDNNDGLTNLDGLSGLTSVGNSLQFSNNLHLANIDGLSNLSTLDNGFNFTNNAALTNIDGLSNLTSLGNGLLVLKQNTNLLNVDGLSNVVGGASYIDLQENPHLTNVDGLSHISAAFQDVFIKTNTTLSNLDGLSGLQSIGGRCEITSNPALQSLGLVKLVVVNGIFFIGSNNALSNIDGLAKLKTVGGHFSISSCPALLNINGLSALETVNENFGLADNDLITNLDALAKLTKVGLSLGIINNAALVDFCGLYNLFHTGTIGGTITIKNNGANTVALSTQPITVNADQSLCAATLSEATIGTATILGCLESFNLTHTDFPEGFVFPVGQTVITWNVTDGAGNTATTTQAITVVDNQVPVITCPGNMTVKCATDVPQPNVNIVTATDNCSAIVTHVGDVITNQTCANRFTLTRTYKATDPAGNSATCSQVITVYDDVPPQINGLTISQTALWPPNHTMRTIKLTYTVTDNCTNTPTVSVSVGSNEAVNGTADGDTDPDWEVVNDSTIRLRAERAANGNGRLYTITVTLNDGCNAPVSQSKTVFVAHNITGPQAGASFKIGSTVSFSGVFQDKQGNKHTAKWLLDGAVAANGSVTEPSGNQNGKVTGSYKFNTAGVYKLQMNVTDQTGVTSYANTNGDLDAIVVIYDPNGGYAYGGGWFPSVAGALVGDPVATGKASYGFAINYRNAARPKGETQFEFKVGDFEFNALNFEYLSVASGKAQFKGTGKIIGDQSGVSFIMTVSDGALDGSGVDRIRLKLFKNGQVYYDNQAGASDADNPTTAVGNNSIIFIQGTPVNSLITSTAQKEKQGEINKVKDLDVFAFPNPSSSQFTISINSNDIKEKITMQVMDMYGRIIETKNVNAGSFVKLGNAYKPGTYFVRVLQGKEHQELKLVKFY